LLEQGQLKAERIQGWETTEPSHTAVAQAVASGAADAGMAIEAAAQARGLGFVPVVSEDYYLVCLKSALEQPATQALLEVLRSDPWQSRLAQLAGYASHRSGEVLSLHRQLPWWEFARTKKKKTL
jgi:putative molybdopterin biosynthesis protein